MVKGPSSVDTLSALSVRKGLQTVFDLSSASVAQPRPSIPQVQASLQQAAAAAGSTQLPAGALTAGIEASGIHSAVVSSQQLAMFMPQPYGYPSMQQALHPVYGPSPYFYTPGFPHPHGYNPVAVPYFPAAPGMDHSLRTAFTHPGVAPGGFMSQDYLNWYEGLVRPVPGVPHLVGTKDSPLEETTPQMREKRTSDTGRQESSKSSDPDKLSRGMKRDSRAARRHPDPQSGAPSTDAILEDFKNNKSLKLEFKDIFGHLVAFSRDQHGSRFIQQKLETVPVLEREAALQEILPKCMELMQDVFGNYVVQKFLEHGTDGQKELLADKMKGNVLVLTHQMYGCRVIQKALEVCSIPTRVALVGELTGPSIVDKAVRDQNGNHVIQKVIEFVPTEHIAYIIDVFIGQVATLSSHLFGCRVIQRVLEFCQDRSRKDEVMREILESTEKLAQDQYGNYVIQHVLQFGSKEQRRLVVQKLAPQLVALSSHKFASNVVEKCLEHGGDEAREALLKELLRGDENETDGPLQQMSKDQYANYVVQKLLEVVPIDQKEALLARVRAHLHSLKKMPYGKHIVSRVEKLLSTGTKTQPNRMRHAAHIPAGAQYGFAPLPIDESRTGLAYTAPVA